jgi:hypothetical protein
LISWFSTNIKSIFTAVVRIIVSLSTGLAWLARFRRTSKYLFCWLTFEWLSWLAWTLCPHL